ncbi:MAG: lipopolysaccharide kinase InaA family protein [Planctomycetota bacterium]
MDDTTRAQLAALGYRDAGDALTDRRGRLVRDTPTRATWEMEVPGLGRVYRKLRDGRSADAVAEWRWLGELASRGFTVPVRILVHRVGNASVLLMRSVPGRALDEWILESAPTGELPRALEKYLVGPVARCVARLHGAGFVHRDLYWNHLFAAEIGSEAAEPALIDVERMRRPWRLRRRRWVVKDLGALLGSWPLAVQPKSLALRFLRTYCGGRLPARWKAFARSILARAHRIRTHVPRYGSPPTWMRTAPPDGGRADPPAPT